jgi:hypothetical protein
MPPLKAAFFRIVLSGAVIADRVPDTGERMTTATLAPSRLTLADRVVPRSVVNNIALMLTGVAVVSATALIEIPMWPVPVS